MTPREFEIALKAKRERETFEYADGWARAGFLAMYILQPHVKKGRQVTMEQLIGKKLMEEAGLTKKKAKRAPKVSKEQALRDEFQEISKGFD